MLKSFDVMSRLISSYRFNPWNTNPLRDLLEKYVDFDAIHTLEEPKLFINATHVRSGQNRIVRNADISLDALLASACLPVLFHAVEIEAEAYDELG